MSIPSEISALVERLNQEINQIEQEATIGLNLIRPILSRFPDNARLTQFFAFLNNIRLLVNNYRRRIQTTVEDISPAGTPDAEIQEAGEDIAALLGVILEAKMRLRRVISQLEDLEL